MYEEYAEPLQLWECKLAIIHCSGHQDSMLIQGIWTNIIENGTHIYYEISFHFSFVIVSHDYKQINISFIELKNAVATSAEDKIAILMSKIKLLGQEYSGTPHCFPIGNYM